MPEVYAVRVGIARLRVGGLTRVSDHPDMFFARHAADRNAFHLSMNPAPSAKVLAFYCRPNQTHRISRNHPKAWLSFSELFVVDLSTLFVVVNGNNVVKRNGLLRNVSSPFIALGSGERRSRIEHNHISRQITLRGYDK